MKQEVNKEGLKMHAVTQCSDVKAASSQTDAYTKSLTQNAKHQHDTDTALTQMPSNNTSNKQPIVEASLNCYKSR